MNKLIKPHLAGLVLMSWLPLALAGCGGGGGGNTLPTTPATPSSDSMTLNGIVTKGPIKGARVSVYLLDRNGKKSDIPLNTTPAITDANGKYSVSIPKTTEPIIIEATGTPDTTYISEVSNKPVPFSAAETLRAVIPNALEAQDVTVSPITQAAVDRLEYVKTASPTAEIASTITGANSFVGTQNNISNILAAPNKNYTASLTVLEQIIQTTPQANTKDIVTLLKNSVTTTTGIATYQTAVQSAVTSLTVSNPALATSIAAETTALQTKLATAPPATTPVPVSLETTPPTTPGDVKITGYNAQGTSITLSWGASVAGPGSSVAVTGYEVYRSTNSSFASKALIASSNTTTFTDTGLTPETTYYYWVKAINANKVYSDFSLITSFKTIYNPAIPISVTVNGQIGSDILSSLPSNDLINPSIPANLTGVARSLDGSSSSVTLTWIAATDNVSVKQYNIYRDGAFIRGVINTSYVDTVPSGKTYRYTVIAQDTSGNLSTASAPFDITPAVSNLGVTVGGEVQVP